MLNIERNSQQEAIPSIKTTVDWSIIPNDIALVPVCYIPNKVFESMDSIKIQHFVNNFHAYLTEGFPPSVQERFVEVQIDCDWTERTKKAYFEFLKKLKQQISLPISTTIRLHQIKYRSKTGIPPVDKGVLMVYNFNAPNKFSSTNSIFDKTEGEKYLSGQKKYELPLDIALPLFSWGLVFRNQEYYSIFNGLTQQECRNWSFLNIASHLPKNYYEVTQDTVIRGLYLRKGDEIEIEEIEESRLLESAQLARKMLNQDTSHIIFYHLNSEVLKNFNNENIIQKAVNSIQ